MASVGLDGALCFETLVEANDEDCVWGGFDENTAAGLCYTSGTTGNPKGALYSHRSTMLHTYAAALPDSLNCSGNDVILPVVPMFHVNAWGLPYIACMVGAKLVFPPEETCEKQAAQFANSGNTPRLGGQREWPALLRLCDKLDPAFRT